MSLVSNMAHVFPGVVSSIAGLTNFGSLKILILEVSILINRNISRQFKIEAHE